MTQKLLYLDMFDTTAYKLAWLVQIPRYIKYLQEIKMYKTLGIFSFISLTE